MAKKQSTTKKKRAETKPTPGIRAKFGAIWHKHWQLIGFSVLILGVLGFIGVQQLLVYNQRQQFKAAEQSLEELSNDIIAATGQPTEVKKDASCGYRSVKWEQGERSCGVGVSLHYSNIKEIPQAKNITKLIDSFLENSSSISSRLDSKLYIDEFVDIDEFKASRDFSFNKNNLRCYVSYRLDTAAIFDEKYFVVSLGCSGSAKAEFYSVKSPSPRY